MDVEKIETIVSAVMKELNDKRSKTVTNEAEKISQADVSESAGIIDLYGGKPTQNIPVPEPDIEFDQIVELNSGTRQALDKTKTDTFSGSLEIAENEVDRLIEPAHAYAKYTAARVQVGRAGTRPKTNTLLKFRYDHAAAVDAVYGEVDQDILDALDLFTVHTKVEEKEVYIRRPDLGRRLSDDSKKLIKEKCKAHPTVQIIASNGLSASAINENLEDVYLSLKQSLNNLNIEVGNSFYVDQGRVGIMDDVGEVLSPDVVVNLIGERPGLVSAESMSAYLCYQPKHGTIESDRMVISNIHEGGIPPIEAGAYLGTVVERILKHQASGVKLIQKEG